MQMKEDKVSASSWTVLYCQWKTLLCF